MVDEAVPVILKDIGWTHAEWRKYKLSLALHFLRSRVTHPMDQNDPWH
jgi:hypothetical protein